MRLNDSLPPCAPAAVLILGLALTLTPAAPAAAADVQDTRLLSEPAVSANSIVFSYADDLWIAQLDGTGARRLTSYPGREAWPSFSPDGATVAFTGEYDGNLDVYVVPAAGGVPRRLTWHPGEDIVRGFTPDGAAVLFTSPRTVHTRRYDQLFTVPVDGGFPTRLPIPHAFKAAISPDGSTIAYVPLGERFRQWKHYRGGTVSRIWLFDVGDHSVVEIPQPPGRSNDTDPMWVGGRVLFLSDRAGEFNLFSFDPATREITQLTHHEDFPVLSASAGAGRVVYEQAGWLHLFDPATNESRRVPVGVAADLVERRPRWVEGGDDLRGAAVSPSGARAVFEARGEIVTVPAEKGDPRNLTQSPGTHETSPAWSPDGRLIAYFSDVSGEVELHVAPQDGHGEVRTFPLDGAGFYEDPKWSPDSSKISFTDNSWSLYILDLAHGKTTKVSSEPIYGPIKTLHHAWSPDSRWLAYTQLTKTYFQRVFLYSVEEGRSHALTDGLSDVAEPVFDAGGKYLYFSASTDAGPVLQWFAQSNADMERTNSLYLAVLPKGVPSPLAKESDEEEPDAGDASEGSNGKDGKGEKDGQEVRVEVAFDGLHERILALPPEAAFYSSLQPGAAGQLYYLKRSGIRGLGGGPETGSLVRFDLDSRKETTLADGVSRFYLTPNGAKVLFQRGDAWVLAETSGKIEEGAGKIPTDDIRIQIDPPAEWAQIFDEAWRINRDYFYDPNMHGADWPAMKEKYAVFLPDLATRRDLNRVLRWMSSELSVGHHRVGGGDRLYEPESIPGGLLGADYDIDHGRYRFAKVYGGLNWNPDLRSPLTEPGVEVQTGEYLLAVDGRDLAPPENLFRRFEGKAGKIVELTVGPSPDGSGARTVQAVPVESEAALRNRDWVEGNLRKVTEATDGRVAYVYVPNTAGMGHTYFKRYFYPQADREAIIVDERYNAGGQLADYYIDLLRRPYIAHWATRYGDDIKTPIASIQGPKVMIIDETAGSGGDLLPWMFRKLGLGTLVGKRTWGGLVGILGFPELMDGGRITAPNLAIWTEDGFIVENEGVPPDIEVEQLPAEVLAGHDPQLEKAIEVALRQLEANPPHEPVKPPYPIRARQ